MNWRSWHDHSYDSLDWDVKPQTKQNNPSGVENSCNPNFSVLAITVKPVLSGHSKIDKTKILMTNGSIMKVESIAECSPWSILQYFWPALSNNWSWKPFFVCLFEWPLKRGFTVLCWQFQTDQICCVFLFFNFLHLIFPLYPCNDDISHLLLTCFGL